MIFTDLYKSPKSPLSRLRHPHHHPVPLAVASDSAAHSDPDLVSKDKTKQKEAVKRYLQTHVRNDWTFIWPTAAPKAPSDAQSEAADGNDDGAIDVISQGSASHQEILHEDETALDTGEEAGTDSDVESVYSTVSDDPLHWKPRLEWASELSDDELPYSSPSPFKFDSPDSIGQAITASNISSKARRRKELRKETTWNDGLACFEARRNAWTSAKTARIRPKPTTPLSPISSKRGKFWRTSSRSTPNAGLTPTSPTLPSLSTRRQSRSDDGSRSPTEHTSLDAALSVMTSRSGSQKQNELLPVETLIPVPPPFLPHANPMRASISPSLYTSIYEKVVVNSLQPSCPINLSDMVRACVSGWKRDGEWPPRVAGPESAALVAVKRKKSSVPAVVSSSTPRPAPGRKVSFSFLGSHGRSHEQVPKARSDSAPGVEDGPGPGKAIKRSLQKALGIGQTMVTAGDGHVAAAKDH